MIFSFVALNVSQSCLAFSIVPVHNYLPVTYICCGTTSNFNKLKWFFIGNVLMLYTCTLIIKKVNSPVL